MSRLLSLTQTKVIKEKKKKNLFHQWVISVSGTLRFSNIFFYYYLPIININNFKLFLQIHFISMATIFGIPGTFSWRFTVSSCYSERNLASEESEFPS